MTRIVGRHAHMMPTLISMFDQLITLAWSHVGLLPTENTTKNRSRIMDTIVTLSKVLELDLMSETPSVTYNVPTKNMKATPKRLRQDI